MKKLYPSIVILFLLIFAPGVSPAQITVVPGVTAALMANKLAGPGVVIINPVLTCISNAYGTFSGPSSLSFDSGIVLTSGQANTTGLATGVNGSATGFASTGNGTAGDPQLSGLIGGSATYDACVLQFDFRPIGDTVKFDYVFGSEEYTDFTCSDFNDVFGFFISGPGYGAPVNVAIIPGTSIPVCINSVNCGATGGWPLSTCTAMGPGSPFCSYYVNNSAGATITYDGLTTTLTAIAHVTPCDTYHLKLGVADAFDDILDSGVFLKAGSLTSVSYSATPLGIDPTDTGFGAQFCIRGCYPGMFVFTNTGSLSDSLTIHFVIGGTAVGGIDYTTIADSVIIPAHDSTDTVFIYGLTTGSGTKTVELYILSTYSCGGAPVIIDSVELTIYDSFTIHINTPDTTICIGQSVFINTTGTPGLAYSWSPASTLNSSTLLSPTATPVVTTTYTLNAALPGSGCAPSSASITISVVNPAVLDVGPPVQITCVGVPLQLGVTATPTGTYEYNWTPATFLNNANIANPVVTPGLQGDFEYVVNVTYPGGGCGTVDSFLLHVLPDSFTLVNPDTGICYPVGVYQIVAFGDTEFTYLWTPSTGVSNPNILTPTITPPGTTSYTITASYPGCPDLHHTITYTVQNAKANIIARDTTFCISYPVPIEVIPIDTPFTLVWSPSAGLSDPTLLEPSFFSPVPGVFTYILTVTSSLGCVGIDTITLRPQPPISIALTPGNTTIPYGSSLQLQATTLSANPLFYYWIPDNGTLNNSNINDPIVTPVDSVTTYTVYGMDLYGCKDSARITINLDYLNDCMPTAFTPNGDGLNDIFRLCNNMQYEKLVDFRVFNRWGQLIFENTNDTKKGWDGTFNGVPQDMGVYNYMIIIARPDGSNKVFKGEVTLIR